MQEYYTVVEVAELLRVRPATVRGWCRRRECDVISYPGRGYRIPAEWVALALTVDAK